jgi:hypothetical protein
LATGNSTVAYRREEKVKSSSQLKKEKIMSELISRSKRGEKELLTAETYTGTNFSRVMKGSNRDASRYDNFIRTNDEGKLTEMT